MLLAVPIAFSFICGLLALASVLEEQRARTTIRLVARSSKLSPEVAEALAATELAPVLAAHGFDERTVASSSLLGDPGELPVDDGHPVVTEKRLSMDGAVPGT